MIEYKQGNLLKEVETSSNVYIAHAVNCRGSWGAGFAKMLKLSYPKSFRDYYAVCGAWGDSPLGSSKISSEGIINLFASRGYGSQKDAPEEILVSLRASLDELSSRLPEGAEVHSPKICSGLFNVSWDHVELAINQRRPDIRWTVWEL